MWKKDEVPNQTSTSQPEPTPRAPAGRAQSVSAPAERATIGRSITIKGEVSGDEDLLIQGRVDGSVDLGQHSVTVGSEGKVKASLNARVVTVEGKVEGDVMADEQIILRSSAWVQGDITAPRVVLEDGARFRGGVDMGEAAERRGKASASGVSQTKKPAETGNGSGNGGGTAKPAAPAAKSASSSATT